MIYLKFCMNLNYNRKLLISKKLSEYVPDHLILC